MTIPVPEVDNLDERLEDCAQRRQSMLNTLEANSLMVLAGASLVTRNRDVEYYFRQDSDVAYLSELPEPDMWIVLAPGREEGEFLVFCQPRDPEQEQWTGYRLGTDGCEEVYGADAAYTLDELDELLPELIKGRDTLYARLSGPEYGQLHDWLIELQQSNRAGHTLPSGITDARGLLDEARQRKTPFEIEQMRIAGAISARGHVAAMQVCTPGMMEFQLEAEINYHFARQGARWSAYDAIVGGGANACILHYLNNDQPLEAGDLVLIDAGAEWQGYAGDITRTFPVNGRFSAPQRALYELVLATEEACIAKAAPGVSIDELQQLAVRLLTEGMVNLGILQGKTEALIESGAWKAYYMHGIGHWLGRDVHDVGVYRRQGQAIALEPGMTLTIEPGLYIPEDDDSVDEQWRGIGIRIEDNILITAEGNEVMTAGVPKAVDAIERLMAEARA